MPSVHGNPVLVLIDHRDLTRVALLRSFSEALPGIVVVAAAKLDDLVGHTTDRLRAAVLHIDHPPLSCGSLKSSIALARHKLNGVPIVTLSERGDEDCLSAAVEGGASAHLTTSMPLDLAAATLRLVMLGGTSFPPRHGDSLAITRPREESVRRRAAQPDSLTQREEEVLKYVGQGAPNKTIAFMLNMSENTVKVHLHRILQKLRLHNRTEVALLANTYFSGHANGQKADAMAQMTGQEEATPAEHPPA